MRRSFNISESLRLRMFFLYRGLKGAFRGAPLNAATYTGSIADRVSGLDPLFAQCSGSSILDIGSADGLVGYEFARRGAAMVHGIDSNTSDVLFAERLFRSVKTESRFLRRDLSDSFESLFGRDYYPLRSKYDIVLFLGIYHHLKRQMSQERLLLLLGMLLTRCSMFFAIRTDLVNECDAVIRQQRFALLHQFSENQKVGELRIYKREEESC